MSYKISSVTSRVLRVTCTQQRELVTRLFYMYMLGSGNLMTLSTSLRSRSRFGSEFFVPSSPALDLCLWGNSELLVAFGSSEAGRGVVVASSASFLSLELGCARPPLAVRSRARSSTPSSHPPPVVHGRLLRFVLVRAHRRRRRRCGFWNNALAKEMRMRQPPENLFTLCWTKYLLKL